LQEEREIRLREIRLQEEQMRLEEENEQEENEEEENEENQFPVGTRVRIMRGSPKTGLVGIDFQAKINKSDVLATRQLYPDPDSDNVQFGESVRFTNASRGDLLERNTRIFVITEPKTLFKDMKSARADYTGMRGAWYDVTDLEPVDEEEEVVDKEEMIRKSLQLVKDKELEQKWMTEMGGLTI